MYFALLNKKRLFKIEENTFKLKDYQQFLHQESTSINAFKTKQQAAFNAEREHSFSWTAQNVFCMTTSRHLAVGWW